MMNVLVLLRAIFFVDKLLKTNNDIELLTNLYKTSVATLGKCGFKIRSCNSNNEKLKSLMKSDGKLIEHSAAFLSYFLIKNSALRYLMHFLEDVLI